MELNLSEFYGKGLDTAYVITPRRSGKVYRCYSASNPLLYQRIQM